MASETSSKKLLPPPISKSARRRQAKQRREHVNTGAARGGETAADEVKGELNADDRKCMVCGDVIEPSALFYDCERSVEHSQCLSCFAEYVRHCCRYYSAGKIPLRCPDPHCKTRVDDLALRHLIAAADADEGAPESLWELYQKAQLNAALAELSLSKDEAVVYCSVCNKYAEIYPRDYSARAAKLSLAFRAWKLEKDRAEFDRAHPAMTKHNPEEDVKQDGGSPESPSVDSRLSVANEVHQGNGGPQVESVESGKDFEYDVPPPEVTQRSVMIDRFQVDPSIGLTSEFFRCRTPECRATVCLKCNSVIACPEAEHCCKTDRAHDLYIEILDTLTESSIRRCPKCGCAGMKDNKCCSITCYDPCLQMWCYVCGQAFDSADSYYAHTGWTLNEEDTNKCPRYLEEMYGFSVVELERSAVMRGTPETALLWFNIEHQRIAIQKLKERCADPALWREVMETKFPNGIWHRKDLDLLEQRNRLVAEFRAKEQLRLARLSDASNFSQQLPPRGAPLPNSSQVLYRS